MPRSLLHEVHEVVLPGIVILFKKAMAHESADGHETLIYLLIHSNELAYLQLITVFVYGNSSPKVMSKSFTGSLLLWELLCFYRTLPDIFVVS